MQSFSELVFNYAQGRKWTMGEMSSYDGWAGPKLGSGLCSSHVVSVTSSCHRSTEAPNVGQVRVSSTPASVYQPVRCPSNSAVRAPLPEVLPSIRTQGTFTVACWALSKELPTTGLANVLPCGRMDS